MSETTSKTTGAGLGSDNTFSDIEQTPAKCPDQAAVEKDGIGSGFDRDAPPPKRPKGRPRKKEPSGKITITATMTVLEDFREICSRMDPPWSLGYGLKSAVAALKKELD